MASAIYETELNDHLGALVADVQTAGVPYVQTSPGPQGVVVLLRPTLTAWQVPFHTRRYIEEQMRSATPPWWAVVPCRTPRGMRQALMADLFELAQRCAQWGELPSCRRYFRWHMAVITALMAHGWYDPTTNHCAPAHLQVDAIERVERQRAEMRTLFPGIPLWQERPTTEEDIDEQY
jgi:hypothetical protein